MKITIYSTRTCLYCFELKDFLRERGVKYQSWYVDDDPANEEEMLTLSNGSDTVPFTVIETEGRVYKIIGFPKARFRRVLKKIGL